jgi:hypothetical protein
MNTQAVNNRGQLMIPPGIEIMEEMIRTPEKTGLQNHLGYNRRLSSKVTEIASSSSDGES